MKAKKNLWRWIFALFLAQTAFTQDRVNLSSTPTDSLTPDICANGEGQILVVWAENDWPIPGIHDILFSLFSDESWSVGQESVSQLYDSLSPDIGADSSGRFHLVYDDGRSDLVRSVFHRSFRPAAGYWSNIQRIYLSTLDSTTPKIGIENSGQLDVLWVQQVRAGGQNQVAFSSKAESQIWPDEYEQVSVRGDFPVASPSMAVKNGSIYACWNEVRDGFSFLYSNRRIDGVWRIPEPIGTAAASAFPVLALDNQNRIHVLFSSTDENVYHTRHGEDGWSVPVIVSSGASHAGPVDMISFTNNTLHAVWTQRTSEGNISVFYGRATADGSWAEPIEVSFGPDAAHPRLDVDDKGEVHVVWDDTEPSGQRDIYYSRPAAAGLKPTAIISASDESGIVPETLTFDGSTSVPGGSDPLSYWWSMGDGTDPVEGVSVSHIFEAPGTYKVRLYVTNVRLLVGHAMKKIEILPGPYPPININVREIEEGGIFYRQKINALTWEENPSNRGRVSVTGYFIYRKLGSQNEDRYEKIGEANGDRFKFADRDFLSPQERSLYTYAVSAVDSQNREGPKGFASPASQQKILEDEIEQ